jgi:LPXTG-site transpeptidase (sortase) family protein
MRFCALALFCSCVFFLLAAPLSAQTGQQTASVGTSIQSGNLFFDWIVDPWTGKLVRTSYPRPDQSLWDPTQVKDYEAALQAEFPPPLGLLIIKDLDLQVPIYNGTEEHILDRGAGRIKGMAKPGEDGNLGISAHRDSFFRGLKDIELGDVVLVQTAGGVEKYEVSDINIVPKEDHSVLSPEDRKAVTLVTCYPFYHIGAAPQRFIVTALPAQGAVE